MNNSEQSVQKDTTKITRTMTFDELLKRLKAPETIKLRFLSKRGNSMETIETYNPVMLEAADELDLLRNKIQDLQAYAEQDSCIVERLRWQLMHAIYCPRQGCKTCAEIEKEVCHG